MTKLRCWPYSRLSRDEDAEQNSLNNQKKILHEYAISKGYEIVGEAFDDNMSLKADFMPHYDEYSELGELVEKYSDLGFAARKYNRTMYAKGTYLVKSEAV